MNAATVLRVALTPSRVEEAEGPGLPLFVAAPTHVLLKGLFGVPGSDTPGESLRVLMADKAPSVEMVGSMISDGWVALTVPPAVEDQLAQLAYQHLDDVDSALLALRVALDNAGLDLTPVHGATDRIELKELSAEGLLLLLPPGGRDACAEEAARAGNWTPESASTAVTYLTEGPEAAAEALARAVVRRLDAIGVQAIIDGYAACRHDDSRFECILRTSDAARALAGSLELRNAR
ncbi:hypothetical protein ACWGMW_16395 [Streptomyces albidoflavus]